MYIKVPKDLWLTWKMFWFFLLFVPQNKTPPIKNESRYLDIILLHSIFKLNYWINGSGASSFEKSAFYPLAGITIECLPSWGVPPASGCSLEVGLLQTLRRHAEQVSHVLCDGPLLDGKLLLYLRAPTIFGKCQTYVW